MKHLLITLSLLIPVLLTIYSSGCRAQRATPDSYTGKQLIFGNGGGFTGIETSYVLLDNGQLFRVATDTPAHTARYTPLKKLSATITRQLFRKATDLQVEEPAFSHPGNIYYFIGMKTSEKTHRITWGDPNHEAPNEAENLYHQLVASLPQ